MSAGTRPALTSTVPTACHPWHVPSPSLPRGLTRRQGLVALALAAPAGLLAACTSSSDEPAPAEGSSAPSTAVASQTALDEIRLIAVYEAALAAVPTEQAAVRDLLADIRDQHRAHLDAFGESPEPPAAPALPAATDRILATLIDVERTAARDRVAACVDAADPQLARLLALVAASEAAHVPALRDLRSTGSGS